MTDLVWNQAQLRTLTRYLRAYEASTLHLAHDEGVYLCVFGGGESPALTVQYARGLDPTTTDPAEVHERARAAVGGDDFAEALDPALPGSLLAQGATRLRIVVRPEELEVVGEV